MAERIDTKRFEFQCEIADFRRRCIEQYERGNITSLRVLGQEMSRFVEKTHRVHPEYLNGMTVEQYIQSVVNS
jgi:hypothetical protein